MVHFDITYNALGDHILCFLIDIYAGNVHNATIPTQKTLYECIIYKRKPQGLLFSFLQHV